MIREYVAENGREKEVKSRLLWVGCYPLWAMMTSRPGCRQGPFGVSMSWATSVGFPEFLYMAPFCSGHQDDDFNYIKSCINHCSKDKVSTDWRE